MLRNAMKDMTEKIEKALSCGALNLDNYDDNYELPRYCLCCPEGCSLQLWTADF